MPAAPARSPSEKAVQTACKRYLRLVGAQVWDTSQPFRAAITPGLPDLLVFLPRQGLVFVECKAPGGRLTPAQRDFRDACQAAGVPYLVVTAAADLAAQLARLEAGGAA